MSSAEKPSPPSGLRVAALIALSLIAGIAATRVVSTGETEAPERPEVVAHELD